MSPTCLLSIDVDDFAIAAFNLINGRNAPAGYCTNLEHEVRVTLKWLDRLKCQATFFVNAQYGLDDGSIIEEIVAHGHAIASHGFKHKDVQRTSLDEFRADVEMSLGILGKYQKRIYGYRPPGFTMPYDSHHLKVLKDCGIAYVSAGPSRSECRVAPGQNPVNLSHGLIHVPISSYRLGGGRIVVPIGYGSLARILPERLYLILMQYWLRHHEFFHFYFHPFEISGLSDETRALMRRHFSSHVQAVLFSLRCRDRGDYFARILSHGQFQSIESFLGFEFYESGKKASVVVLTDAGR